MSDYDDGDTAPDSNLGVELYREYWGRGEEIVSLQAEKEHNRRAFGQTYREVNGPEHHRCIVFCLAPGQRNAVRCPVCYGKVTVRPMNEEPGIEPEPTRGERMAAWAGKCSAAFWEAVAFPFRVGREHTIALVRDILQDAMASGLSAEVDGLSDILTVLQGIEGELRAIRDAEERENA